MAHGKNDQTTAHDEHDSLSVRTVLTRLWAMIQKELIVTVVDKGTRRILFLPLILQSILFGYGATFNLEHVPYVVFQDSYDATATEIVHRIQYNPSFDLVRMCTDEPCYRQSLDRGEALLGLYISAKFPRDHILFVATDARNTASANTALGYVQAIVNELNQEAQAQAGALSRNINIEYRYLYNSNNLTRYTIMTGMILALSMIQVLMLSSLSVSREREEGTFDMMLMAPLTPVEILISKAVVPTVIAICQGLILFLICMLWFEIPFLGNFGALLTVIAIFSLSTVGLGLAISAIASTSQQSQVMAFVLVLPFIILSGMITPISAMPTATQYLSLLNPMRYGYEAVKRIYLEGQTLWEVSHLMLPLLGLGMVTLSLSIWLFRGKLS